MRKRYKTLFLDWDGTLSVSRFWEHWQFDRPQEYGLIQERLFRARPDIIVSWMRGQMTSEECVNLISHDIGLSRDFLLTELEQSCRMMRFVDPGVARLIAEIRKCGLKVVIATDNMDTFPRWTVPALNLNELFDDILDSHTLGGLKKDTTADGESVFFAGYIQQNNIEPKGCLLIDDSVGTAAAVQSFGIDVIRLETGEGLAGTLFDVLQVHSVEPKREIVDK